MTDRLRNLMHRSEELTERLARAHNEVLLTRGIAAVLAVLSLWLAIGPR